MARPVIDSISQRDESAWVGPRERLSGQGRLAWLAVGVVCAFVLGTAAWLRPDPRGFGTHELLGMPPCGFLINSGLPCPTCGMTTAFSLFVHGHPAAAFMAQPAGLALAVGTVLIMFVGFHAAIRGYFVQPNWTRLGPVRVSITLGLVLLGGWAFKLGYGLWTGALPVR